MADDLSAELDLSIEKALSSVDELRNQIDKATQDAADEFDNDFAKAISGVPDVQIVADTTDVEPAITTAIVDTDSTVTLDPDADAVTPAIETSIGAADPTLAIEPDADAVAPAIDAAIGSVDPTIAVDADTSAAVAEMAAAGEGVTATMAVDADTAPAVAEIEGVVSQLSGQNVDLTVNVDTSQAVAAQEDLSAASNDAGDSMDTAAIAGQGLSTATSLSSGSIDTLTNAVGGSLGQMGPWGAALAGSVVALGSFTNQAVSSLGATQRLGNTFGQFQGQIEQIQVGNLSTSLKDLALNTGSSGSAMRNAASDSFQMVTSFGVGAPAAANYAAQVQALAARAVALNPELGETGAVAGRLEQALRSGRDRGLVPYNLGLTSQEIAAKASQITLADHRTEVTAADKAMAGAALATQNLGAHLQQDIAEGAQDPILQVRTLTKEFSSATTEIGKPLVAPMLDALHAALPSVKSVGEALGQLAQGALPILTTALQAVAPIITAFATGLEIIGPAGIQVIGVIAAVGYAISNVTQIIDTFQVALTFATTIMELNPFVLLATGIAVAVTALGIFGGASDDASASTQQLTSALAEQNGQFDANSIQLVSKDLGDLKSGMTAAGISTRGYTTALQTASGATKVGRTELQNFLDRQNELVNSNPYFIGVLERISPELGNMAQHLVDTGNASYDLKRKIIEQALATADAGKETRLNTAAQVEQAQALDFTKEANDAALKAAKDHKQALFDQMTTTQQLTLATQAQAAVDALAVQHSAALALASRDVAAAHGAVATELLTTADTFANAQAAEQRYNDGLGTAKEATDALQQASSLLGSELDRLLGRFLSADQSTNNFELALLDMGNQLFANGFAFDENSKAGLTNQNVVDDLGSKAIAAGKAIYDSTGNLTAAKKPLEDFRGSIVKLRDDMATAGNTAGVEFADKTLAGVDKAIAGLGADAGPFGAAAQGLGQAGAAGGMLAQADWVALGAYLSGQAVTAATFTQADWQALGAYLGDTGATALGEATANYYAGGHALGIVGATGQGDALQNWINTANSNTGAAVTAVNNKQGDMRGAGKGAGDNSATGLGEGMNTMPAKAGAAVNEAAGAIAIAGITVGGFAATVGVGIGEALVGGIAGGIDASAHSISESLNAAIHEAVTKAHGSGPPYEAGRDVIGIPLATGISDGITKTLKPIDLGPMLYGKQQSAVGPKIGRDIGRTGTALANHHSESRTAIQFNVSVNGVTNPAVARTIGEKVGEGAVDALTRRGVVTTARLG